MIRVVFVLLCVADSAAAVLAGIPILLPVLQARGISDVNLGRAILGSGVLLALHFLYFVLWVQHMKVVPTLDPNPVDNLILETVNWSIPAAVCGSLLTIGLRRRILLRSSTCVGLFLLTFASVGFVWHAKYLFDQLLDNPLSQHVWWL